MSDETSASESRNRALLWGSKLTVLDADGQDTVVEQSVGRSIVGLELYTGSAFFSVSCSALGAP